MKKFVRLMSLVLVLLLAVCVFVACNDNTGNGGNGGGGGDTPGDEPGDTTQKFTATFQFIDPNGKELEANIERRNIGYGEEARFPSGYVNNVTKFADYVLIGWDSDGDGEADEGYKSVKKNLTIKAVFREKETFKVKFYDTPTHYTEVSVKEGAAIDMTSVTCTPVVGQIFKSWVNSDKDDRTTIDCARSNASFVAEFAKINSVNPMVEQNTNKIDGKKDDAYLSGAYLPINEERHADRKESTYTSAVDFRPTVHNGPIPGTDGEMSSWTTSDAWLLWDGDYIYMLVEVSDKTLTYRNPKYVQLNVNAWLNDNIECYFNFEQASTSDSNHKKLGLDAMSQKIFANSIAEYGKNSTHYEEMAGAARCAYGYYENGKKQAYDETDGLTADAALLKATDDVGVQYAETLNAAKNYAYRIELRFAAKTEGVPDKANFPVDDNGRLPEGYLLEDGELEGTTVPALTDKEDPKQVNMEYYRFTEGEKLQVGSFVRFSLQINDLMVSIEQLMDPTSGYYEGDPNNDEQMRKANLYKADGVTDFYPPFVPSGNTQYQLSGYVAFSLGDKNSAAKWEVYELKGSGIETEMQNAQGEAIVQGSELVTVQIAQ
ncbi:MAG: hypothetical protein J6W28_05725 [Clostridia bacterium]|nr:hypothetical protein [Clostridia bacterium]